MLLFTEEIASVGPQSQFQANWSHRAELKCIHCSDFRQDILERTFQASKTSETIGTFALYHKQKMFTQSLNAFMITKVSEFAGKGS